MRYLKTALFLLIVFFLAKENRAQDNNNNDNTNNDPNNQNEDNSNTNNDDKTNEDPIAPVRPDLQITRTDEIFTLKSTDEEDRFNFIYHTIFVNESGTIVKVNHNIFKFHLSKFIRNVRLVFQGNCIFPISFVSLGFGSSISTNKDRVFATGVRAGVSTIDNLANGEMLTYQDYKKTDLRSQEEFINQFVDIGDKNDKQVYVTVLCLAFEPDVAEQTQKVEVTYELKTSNDFINPNLGDYANDNIIDYNGVFTLKPSSMLTITFNNLFNHTNLSLSESPSGNLLIRLTTTDYEGNSFFKNWQSSEPPELELTDVRDIILEITNVLAEERNFRVSIFSEEKPATILGMSTAIFTVVMCIVCIIAIIIILSLCRACCKKKKHVETPANNNQDYEQQNQLRHTINNNNQAYANQWNPQNAYPQFQNPNQDIPFNYNNNPDYRRYTGGHGNYTPGGDGGQIQFPAQQLAENTNNNVPTYQVDLNKLEYPDMSQSSIKKL